MEEKKVEIKLELPESIDKSIDNTLNKPTKTLGEIVTTVLEYWYNTSLLPMQKYNITARAELNKYAEEVNSKIRNIPEENRTESSVNILGPAIDGLKYNLNEEHIKEMFTNIIISDIDIRTKNHVLPSYIEIVKQLSKDDAIFLKDLQEGDRNDYYAAIELKYVLGPNRGYNKLDKYFYHEKKDLKEVRKINPVVIDNLQRLNIIELQFQEAIVDEEKYKKIFDLVKGNYVEFDQSKLKYNKGLLSFTKYGENFANICLK